MGDAEYEPTLLADSDAEREAIEAEAEEEPAEQGIPEGEPTSIAAAGVEESIWPSRERSVEFRRLLLDAEVQAAKKPKYWWER
eukprot:123533-Amphidinium_carterae.1